MNRGKGAIVFTLAMVMMATVVAWLLWARCGLKGCPDVARLRGFVPEQASVVVDRSGGELGKLFRIRRILVPLDSLPEYVPAAFVAIEDQRFWEHGGVDWTRVAGAAWANVRALGIAEGFSTITMQLARNIFPEQLPYSERTLSRKLAEMRVAREIEARYSKHQILELYLNQIYFGSNAWGIEAAAQEYFGKSAKELTLAEGALLAGVIRAPHHLNPRLNPRGALARRQLVLRKMVDQGIIDADSAATAASAPLVLSRGEVEEGTAAPYFMEEVRRILEQELGESVYTGGYTIHTTLDPGVQEVAEAELRDQLAAIEAGRYGGFRHPVYGSEIDDDGTSDPSTPYLQGAVVVMDVRTGSVLAMVGGRDYSDSRFNRATQARRQPGSAFKPFVFAAALSEGYTLTSHLQDTPLRLVMDDGTVWEPGNYGGNYAGVTTLRDALVYSRNAATIRLANQVGIDRVIALAQRLGISGPIPRVPSIAIGSAEVTLLEIVTAYASFASLGRRPEPRLVTRVVDPRGRVVWRQPPRVRRVLDPAISFMVTDLLRDVVDRGTGVQVRGVGFRGAAAGKTGTTNAAADVWFIGYTPERVAGVWIGFDTPRQIVGNASGGTLAAPVWGRVMRRSGAGGAGDWSMPAGIERLWIDAGGRVVARDCPVARGPVRAEYFLAGTAPRGGCGTDLLPPGWMDSLDALPDSTGVRDAEDERWWYRLRRRIFGPGKPVDSVPGDVAPGDTLRRPPPAHGPDSQPAPTEPGGPPASPRPDLLGRPKPGAPSTPTRPRPDTTG